jgi:HK97 family phage major capsid protein
VATYTNITSRADAAALIPEQVVNSMLGKATEASAAMRLFKRVPVAATQVRFPILSALPIAYWVTGDTGLKQTTEVNWDNKYLDIEEIAAILPIPQNVVDDVSMDIWGEIEPLLAEAVARVLDAAIFFGINAPAVFPDDVLAAAAAAGNDNQMNNDAEHGGFMGDFDETLALLEADGYDLTGVVAKRSLRAYLRGARSTTGDQLDRDRVASTLSEIDGVPIAYVMAGLWPGANPPPIAFLGDFANEFVLGVRKDVTIDFSTDAVIQDGTGAIKYNLFQQDMVAARVTFRAGWQVANTINNEQPTEANRYPVAVLTGVNT